MIFSFFFQKTLLGQVLNFRYTFYTYKSNFCTETSLLKNCAKNTRICTLQSVSQGRQKQK